MILEIWQDIKRQAREGEDNLELLSEIRKSALEKKENCSIKFGTSGWRAIIGEEFTVYNVQKVTLAIINFFKEYGNKLQKPLGITSFQEFQRKGVLLGHDTRFLGPEFAKSVAAVFQKAGVKVFYASVATTPEFSAAMKTGKFAFSINLTASHNPAEYQGYKCNSFDGGSLVKTITNIIERYIKEVKDFEIIQWSEVKWQKFDILQAYKNFISENRFVDFSFCKEIAQKGVISLATDSVFGATKNRLFNLLGRPKSLTQFRISENPVFNGESPEPSESKIAQLLKPHIDKQNAKLKLGAIMDADGDRVQFYDGERVITMNQFGAIAFHYLVTNRKKTGGVAKSVATSQFATVIANDLGRSVHETEVGFKNFRDNMDQGTPNPAAICFEESDGISGFGHTFEKDGLAGFLLALEIMGRTRQTLTGYLKTLQKKYGSYFPMRGKEAYTLEKGDDIDKVMTRIKDSYTKDQKIRIGHEEKLITQVISIDGIKLILEDQSWILIRPSGTEPVIRIYSESTSREQALELIEVAKQIFKNMTSKLNAHLKDIRDSIQQANYQLTEENFDKLINLYHHCLKDEKLFGDLKARTNEYNLNKYLLNVDNQGMAVPPIPNINTKFLNERKLSKKIKDWFLLDKDSNHLMPARWISHFFGFRHRVAHIFLLDKKFSDCVIIQLRSFEHTSSPAHFDIPVGGHANGIEPVYEAAKRELLEELGLIAMDDKFDKDLAEIGHYCYEAPPKRPDFYNIEHRTVYKCDLYDQGIRDIKFTSNNGEIVEVAGLIVIRTSELENLLGDDYLNKRVASGLLGSFKYFAKFCRARD